MNETYTQAIQSRIKTTQVAEWLEKIINIVDFDSIKTVFDVGSWHLNESVDFAKILPNVVVHAFEPNPTSVQRCYANRESQIETIKNRLFVHDVALCDKDGVIPFYPLDVYKSRSMSAPNHGISSLLLLQDDKRGQWTGDNWVQSMVMVRSFRLDTWCKSNNIYPDMIWSDVQGAELLLFRGATDVLKKNVKVVISEVGLKPYYKGHTLKPEIDALLKNDLGFVEVDTAFAVMNEFEANTVYINPRIINS